MGYDILLRNGRLYVVLRGDIDAKEATNLRQSLFPFLQKGLTGMTFHLGGVTGLDSSGLGLLLAVSRTAAEAGVRIVWEDAADSVRARMMSVGLE